MKRFFTLFLGLIFAVGLVGCDSDDNGGEATATAQVRFIHAIGSSSAGQVDILLDGETIRDDFSFSISQTLAPNVTDYVEVPLGTDAQVEVQSADNSTTFFTANVANLDLDEDAKYTVVAAGANNPQPILLQDETITLQGEQIGLRLIHASQNAGTVDIYLTPTTDISGATPLLDDFEFGQGSSELLLGGSTGQFAAQDLSGEQQFITVTPGSSQQALLDPIPVGGSGATAIPSGTYVTGIALDVEANTPPAGAAILIDEASTIE